VNVVLEHKVRGRLFRASAIVRAILTSVVLFVFVLHFASGTARADTGRVSVTINNVTNRACIDQKIFCGKPDMFVRTEFRQDNGQRVSCSDTTTERNFNVIGPLTACTGVPVSVPADLTITVFDVDETQLPKVAIEGEIRLSSSGSGATLPFFSLNGMPQTIVGPQATATVTATVALIQPMFGSTTLKLSRPAIDPTLGDRTLASGTIVMSDEPTTLYKSGARVRFSVQAPTGVVSTLGEGVVPASGFNLDWDGKIDGRAVAPGVYLLRATLVNGGQTIEAPVTVVAASSGFEASLATPDPWNPGAGPALVNYRLNPAGRIAWEIAGPSPTGTPCQVQLLPVIRSGSSGLLLAGNGTLPIPVVTSAGALPTGNYCVRLKASQPGGAEIGTKALELNLRLSSLRLVATLSPAVPWILPHTTAVDANGVTQEIPASPVYIVVRALDAAGNERPTGQITVRAIPFLIIPVPNEVITTQTCTGTSVCRMQISMATMMRATEVIFDATASDVASPANSPPPEASLAPRAAALVWGSNRAGPVSVPVSGNIAQGFNNVGLDRTQDVAFHAGTGVDLTVPAQSTRFSEGIGRILEVFFGGDSEVGPTSVTADAGQSVAFWLARAPAVIDTTAARPGFPTWPLCALTRLDSVSFADVQAVFHDVNCRDNAGNGVFTSELGEELAGGRVTWHEFHHAAYQLADEYPPDGGYFQTSMLPNVMKGPAECALFGAEPNFCAQIGTTGWWRAAPMPDVMIDNTRENLDDMRLAKWTQNNCASRRC
jgi:hypothetical protein